MVAADQTTTPAKWPQTGDLFLIASVFAWGVNFPIAKFVLEYMSPLVFSSTRYFTASAILFSLVYFSGQSLRISLKEAVQLFVIGLLGIALFQGGWAYGLNLTTASKASILVATSPVFATLLVLLRGERTSILGWAGILVSLGGVFIVINNSFTEVTVYGGSIIGDLFIIGASFVWAIYTIVSGPMVVRRGPIFVTAWAMLFGAIILFCADMPAMIYTEYQNIPLEGWIAWSVTALLGAALAFVWYCSGISRLGVARGMSYSFLIPIIAISTSVLFFDESFSLIQIIGVAVVLGGIHLTRKSR
ncbi:DMT family transporter [Sneathiella glossodoripedis]|uniref:DMT family transporter n=1 Tax=Sneathiella glossodoripedis TaxID=418853 RepID=UPI0004726E2A|nr:DMT family transporter [Sneathiella glossodoripedis]